MTDLCVHSSLVVCERDFRLYDNILYRNQLAHGVRLLAADRRRDDAFDETPWFSAMARLLVIYILPLFGIVAYLSFGELHLGKRRAERQGRNGRQPPAG